MEFSPVLALLITFIIFVLYQLAIVSPYNRKYAHLYQPQEKEAVKRKKRANKQEINPLRATHAYDDADIIVESKLNETPWFETEAVGKAVEMEVGSSKKKELEKKYPETNFSIVKSEDEGDVIPDGYYKHIKFYYIGKFVYEYKAPNVSVFNEKVYEIHLNLARLKMEKDDLLNHIKEQGKEKRIADFGLKKETNVIPINDMLALTGG